jgi:hypothetical protein
MERSVHFISHCDEDCELSVQRFYLIPVLQKQFIFFQTLYWQAFQAMSLKYNTVKVFVRLKQSIVQFREKMILL